MLPPFLGEVNLGEVNLVAVSIANYPLVHLNPSVDNTSDLQLSTGVILVWIAHIVNHTTNVSWGEPPNADFATTLAT